MRSHLVPQPRYLSWTMPAPLTSLLETPLLEPVLLLGASRRARALPDAARARMKPYADAAQSRYRIALELCDRESQGAALSLLREAALLALCALAAADSEAPATSSPKAAWARFDALTEPPGALITLVQARALLATDDVLAAEALYAADVTASRAAAEETVAWLLGLAEARSPSELRRARFMRSSLFVSAAIVIVWAGLSYWFVLSALSDHAG